MFTSLRNAHVIQGVPDFFADEWSGPGEERFKMSLQASQIYLHLTAEKELCQAGAGGYDAHFYFLPEVEWVLGGFDEQVPRLGLLYALEKLSCSHAGFPQVGVDGGGVRRPFLGSGFWQRAGD
ncbi:hypothetical protein R1sor_027366 [Riccia sorocarpa]|uniref:Uncharacterized protein n=1 Tax=Riccia sorocarpa TaxID=122646 RepID=A0ABD3GE18_9MARC